MSEKKQKLLSALVGFFIGLAVLQIMFWIVWFLRG